MLCFDHARKLPLHPPPSVTTSATTAERHPVLLIILLLTMPLHNNVTYDNRCYRHLGSACATSRARTEMPAPTNEHSKHRNSHHSIVCTSVCGHSQALFRVMAIITVPQAFVGRPFHKTEPTSRHVTTYATGICAEVPPARIASNVGNLEVHSGQVP